MSLTNKGGRFFGTYENDAKDSCSVTGNLQAETRRVAFQIVCPKWDIRMQGLAPPNGKTISGNYQAYVDDAGGFKMVKQ